MNIEIGQAIEIDDGISVRYGVVMSVHNGINYFPVDRIFPNNCGLADRVHCYDDADAIKERDQHHIRMIGCPPPMSIFGKHVFPNSLTTENIYVDADPEHLQHLSNNKLKYAKVLDNGIKFGDINIDKIYNHPWNPRTHREFLKKDFTELNKDETTKHAFGTYNGRKLPEINKTNDSDDIEYE